MDTYKIKKNPFDKELIEKPVCPFCHQEIERPRELEMRRPSEMPLGLCSCGAAYAFDVTGHNLGTAFNEALVFSCNMDWDLAFDLVPQDDYLEQVVENYDFENHLVVPYGIYEGRRIKGALYFIRLQDDIQEATIEGARKKINRATPPQVKKSYRPARKKLSKEEVKQLIESYDVDNVLAAAGEDNRITRDLQRFLYSDDQYFRWKTADLLGRACAVVATYNPSASSDLLKKMFTTVRDTAASNWGAIDTIGEIIGNSPKIFSGYVPELTMLLKRHSSLQPAVIRAMGRIAKAKPELIQRYTSHLVPFFQDTRCEVRGYAAWAFGYLDASEAAENLKSLLNDDSEINIYENGTVTRVPVSTLAQKALDSL